MPVLITIVIVLSASAILLLFLPLPGKPDYRITYPEKQFHEADAVLSRRKLIPGTELYSAYYKKHPEFLEPDRLSRENPGLLSPDSKYYDPATFLSAESNFSLIEHLSSETYGKPAEVKVKTDPEKLTAFFSSWSMETGVHSIGITRLKPHHLYSHKGRGPRSGEPISNSHPYAIAFTVEMDHSMMQTAPEGPTVLESSEQYLRSGLIALKIAGFIRNLGYEATAHIDGNYEVICPLVAADAGLGTIGRMGLLITPRLGPRVRIAVVTTDIPLKVSSSEPDVTVIDFCQRCKKCAVVCPSRAIPEGEMKKSNGSLRWRINSEKCYHYWTQAGTDCGRCVTACPYSHPDNSFHIFIRWGIKNNLFFRRLALKLDNIFYGHKPRIRPVPEWLKINGDQ